jgi:predicted dinucleotide-utilizing enzyme
MKLTIIPEDAAVYIDGVCVSGIDISFVPNNIHAIQWDGNFGEIEYKTENKIKPNNLEITEILPYMQSCIDKHAETLIKIAEAAAAEQAAALANQTTP